MTSAMMARTTAASQNARSTRSTSLSRTPKRIARAVNTPVPTAITPTANAPEPVVVTLDKTRTLDLVARATSAGESNAIDGFNRALGCKTDEVAIDLLLQVVKLNRPTADGANDAINKAIALIAEMQPTTATEAMLAAMMIGTQQRAMTFLTRALEVQTTEAMDANVLRATRLMRVFNEQLEAMAKLKGKGGQQRVVVEHVNVESGGQAIVGAVMAGGRGTGGDERR